MGGIDRAVGTETPPVAIVKKDSVHRGPSQQESPDDGLGGSFARGESVVIESERSVSKPKGISTYLCHNENWLINSITFFSLFG